MVEGVDLVGDGLTSKEGEVLGRDSAAESFRTLYDVMCQRIDEVGDGLVGQASGRGGREKDVEERGADFKLGGSIFGLRCRKAALVYTTRRRLGEMVVKIEYDIPHLPASRCGTAFNKLHSNARLLASQTCCCRSLSCPSN